MKTIYKYPIFIVAALIVSAGTISVAQAQVHEEVISSRRPALAAPIQVAGARTRMVPSAFMKKLAKGEESQAVEVLDVAVKVSSRALAAMPPSLQPRLHIGGNAYPIQRSEYSNWDARKEKPIEPNVPVGETQTLHFFIEGWREVPRGQAMMLSVLSADE